MVIFLHLHNCAPHFWQLDSRYRDSPNKQPSQHTGGLSTLILTLCTRCISWQVIIHNKSDDKVENDGSMLDSSPCMIVIVVNCSQHIFCFCAAHFLWCKMFWPHEYSLLWILTILTLWILTVMTLWILSTMNTHCYDTEYSLLWHHEYSLLWILCYEYSLLWILSTN